MGGFDWIGIAAASTAGGILLVAAVVLGRREAGRRAAPVNTAVASEPRRRIDVVAIDEDFAPESNRKANR